MRWHLVFEYWIGRRYSGVWSKVLKQIVGCWQMLELTFTSLTIDLSTISLVILGSSTTLLTHNNTGHPIRGIGWNGWIDDNCLCGATSDGASRRSGISIERKGYWSWLCRCSRKTSESRGHGWGSAGCAVRRPMFAWWYRQYALNVYE